MSTIETPVVPPQSPVVLPLPPVTPINSSDETNIIHGSRRRNQVTHINLSPHPGGDTQWQDNTAAAVQHSNLSPSHLQTTEDNAVAAVQNSNVSPSHLQIMEDGVFDDNSLSNWEIMHNNALHNNTISGCFYGNITSYD
jgi:hypothetical protein